MNDTVLSLRNISVKVMKESGSPALLSKVSLDLKKGEFLGLVGESGSGKSTLAGAILRTLPPPLYISSGSAWCEGQDIFSMDEKSLRKFRWQTIAMVFQSAMNCLNPFLNVKEQLLDTIACHKPELTKNEQLAQARESLTLVGLDPNVLGYYPHQLSGGMRQRVNIAMAIILRPKVLLLDEPTTALDVVTQKQILEGLKDLQKKLGITIIMITHDLPVVLDFCDRAAVMYQGKIVEMGPTSSLLRYPRHPYTKSLLDSFPSLFHTSQLVPNMSYQGRDPNPNGCSYANRCSLQRTPCRDRFPTYTGSGDEGVRCHFPLN